MSSGGSPVFASTSASMSCQITRGNPRTMTTRSGSWITAATLARSCAPPVCPRRLEAQAAAEEGHMVQRGDDEADVGLGRQGHEPKAEGLAGWPARHGDAGDLRDGRDVHLEVVIRDALPDAPDEQMRDRTLGAKREAHDE